MVELLPKGIRDSNISCLFERGVIKKVKSGSVLFYQSDLSNEVYYLLSGRIKLSFHYPHGTELIIALLDRNAFLGLSALNGNENSVTAVSTTDSVVAAISTIKLIEEADKNSKLLMEIVKSVNMENKELMDRISCIALTDASARIVQFLKTIADNGQKYNIDTIKSTHQEIACMLGLSRSVVTSTLNSLAGQGIIMKGRSEIKIIDACRLNRLLE